jgi:hypothetical protein
MSFVVKVGVNEDGALEDLRFANLSLWDAVGELLDNSISAINKQWSDGQGGKVEISYYLDAGKPVLRITDNGVGIDKFVLQNKFFEAHNRPDDRTGLNEFGIGMKHGLATIGDRYRIESWPAGSSKKYTVPFFAFDDPQSQVGLMVDEADSDQDTLGTTVTIYLRREWNREEWDLLLDHLRYAYRTFLRGYNANPLSERETISIETSYTGQSGDVSERTLQAPELKMLKEHPAGQDQLCELDQPIQQWRENFEIVLALSEEPGVEHKITGWMGILETGDTLRKVGIAIVRRGRALEVTGSFGWLPSNIVGKGNDFGVQRVVGELYWDSMPAQQTKTIPPDSKFLSELAVALSVQFWTNSPLRHQNKNYRRNKSCKSLGVPVNVVRHTRPVARNTPKPTATVAFGADPFRGIEFTVQFVEDSAATPIHRTVSRYDRRSKTFLIHLRPGDVATYKASDISVRKALVAHWSVAALVLSGAAEIDRYEDYLVACEVFEA